MGLVRPRAGSIRFDGVEIRGCEPFEACRAGLGFVPENCRLFAGLTVAENFETARRAGSARPAGARRTSSSAPLARNAVCH